MSYDENGQWIEDPPYTPGPAPKYNPQDPNIPPGYIYGSSRAIDTYINQKYGSGTVGDPTVTPPPPASGPVTPPGSTLTQPGPFQAPPPVNLGGPPGIPYIPPTPTFTGANAPPTFSAPTADQALNDPGYQFRRDQGRDSLQSWAAAKGTLNDSSTAKALEDYGQGAASQEYQSIWNRDYNAYGTQKQNWSDTVLQPAMAGYATQSAAGQHQSDADYLNSWNRWLQDWNIFNNKVNWATANA